MQSEMKVHQYQCIWCGNKFLPSWNHQRFCGQSCASKWRWSQPEIAKRTINNRDHFLAGKRISEAILRNPKELARRSKQGLKQTAYLNKTWGNDVGGFGLFGKNTPRAELIARRMFPNAITNLKITTGQDPKTGEASIYWPDLSWPEIQLNVEIDGIHHSRPKYRARDLLRDQYLKERGWTIVRFTNSQVLNYPKRIKEVIETKISELTTKRHLGRKDP